MLGNFINTALAGQQNAYYADAQSRQLRAAEADVRNRLRAEAKLAEPGSTINVSSNYHVGRNGGLSLADATITTNARPNQAHNLRSVKEEVAPPLEEKRQNRQQAKPGFSDFTRPSLHVASSDLLELFGLSDIAALPASAATASATQETIFVRGVDGSYYPVGESDAAIPASNDLSRSAREAAGLLNGELSGDVAKQAAYNVAKLYSANTQSMLFTQGSEMQTVA